MYKDILLLEDSSGAIKKKNHKKGEKRANLPHDNFLCHVHRRKRHNHTKGD